MKEHLFLLVLALIPLTSKADDSGSCGENVTYKYEESTKTLTLSGTGPMTDLLNGDYLPWGIYKNEIIYVIIEDGITSIGSNAFYCCSSMVSITIPTSVVSIGNFSFCGCESLKDITIPKDVKSIGAHAFGGCEELRYVTLPSNVSIISEGTFSDCHLLSSVEIPEGVTTIGKYAFKDCKNLKTIKLPNSIISIEEGCFYGSGLTTITIPNLVTSINKFTFQYCRDLKSIVIPNSVTSIQHDAFCFCSSLGSIDIPNSMESIEDYAFGYCVSLSSVNLPKSVKTIGAGSFCECTGLKTISFPENLKIINAGILKNCTSLSDLVIPSQVEFIYQGAFADCTNLKEVKVLASKPPFAYDNSFTNYSVSLKVPAESISNYLSTSPWSSFNNIESLGGEIPTIPQCAKPDICYENGTLFFTSETEGVDFNYSITNSDNREGTGSSVNLTVTYNISVYASKVGYLNSEVAYGTLCWIEKEPNAEGITNDISMLPSNAVMIQSQGGLLTIQGADEGSQIKVYGIDGIMVGSVVSQNGQAQVNTDLQPGSIAIIKIGNEKSVKIIVK